MVEPSTDALMDIVLPDGQRATVPASDYKDAILAGATPAPVEVDDGGGGAVGKVAAGVLGAGSTATLGQTDQLLRHGAFLAGGLVKGDVAGGRDFQKEVMTNLKDVRERNPGSSMIGEGAGLFLNPMGVSGVGEAAKDAVGARLGEGLLGKVGSMGARGLTEGSLLGYQHQLTEDALGDHDSNGEKLFHATVTDGFIGGLAGGVLGAAGHYLGPSASLIRGRGPFSDAALDDVAGVAGGGRAIHAESKAQQAVVEELRKAGATSEQAAHLVDGINTMANEAAAKGPVSGLVDAAADAFKSAHAGENAEMQDILSRGYVERAKRVAAQDGILDTQAQKMARSGTKAMRDLEDTVNEIHFTDKSSQIAKAVDTSLLDTQRDTVAKLMQDVDTSLKFWDGTAAKGGEIQGGLVRIRKQWQDTMTALTKIGPETKDASAQLFMRTNGLKQQVDKFAQWGREYGMPEAVSMDEHGTRAIANKLRSALEDESVWGKAATQHAALNESYSTSVARSSHFKNTMGVRIDQQMGKSIPEIDFQKTRGLLSQLRGNSVDEDIQGVKSTQAYIDGLRARASKVLEHADVSTEQAASIKKGLESLHDFEKTFTEAKKEAAIVNNLKGQQLAEQGKGMGGLLGLVSDVVTKPLTTMERLAQVRSTVKSVEDGVSKGLEKFFGQKGPALVDRIAPRARDEVIKDIGQVKELASNPESLQGKLSQWVGDLKTHAPQTAEAMKATAARAIAYLAREAPPAMVSTSILAAHKPTLRYSDTQLATWERKRDAVLGASKITGPEVIISQMTSGHLNRDAIDAIKFVSPQLYQEIQFSAQEKISDLAHKGLLDDMPIQQQAAIASLLQVPAGEVWQPDFMLMMQAAKATRAPSQSQPGSGGTPTNSKRAIKINTNVFATESGRIEGKDAA